MLVRLAGGLATTGCRVVLEQAAAIGRHQQDTLTIEILGREAPSTVVLLA